MGPADSLRCRHLGRRAADQLSICKAWGACQPRPAGGPVDSGTKCPSCGPKILSPSNAQLARNQPREQRVAQGGEGAHLPGRRTGTCEERLDQPPEQLSNGSGRTNQAEVREGLRWHSLPSTGAGHALDSEFAELGATREAVGKLVRERRLGAQHDVLGRTPSNLTVFEKVHVGRLSVLKA